LDDNPATIEEIRSRLREGVESRVRGFIERVMEEHGSTEHRTSFTTVPFVGDGYLSARKKILVCGRADDAGRSGSGRSLADLDLDGDWYGDHFRSQERLIEELGNPLAGEERTHEEEQRWWESVREVVSPLLATEQNSTDSRSDEGTDKDHLRNILNSVAYTSLDRVSSLSGLRSSDLDHLLRKYSTLKEEIEVLKPDILWFPTGFDHDKILRMSMGYFDLDELPPLGIALVHSRVLRESLPEGAFVVRTLSPESGWFDTGIVSQQIRELAHSAVAREIRHVKAMLDRLSRLNKMGGWSGSEDPSYVAAGEAISSAAKHLAEYNRTLKDRKAEEKEPK
jgi:hypothetical protein